MTLDQLAELPEFASIEAFAEFLMDDERTSFNAAELQDLCAVVRQVSSKVRKELEGYGFTLAKRRHGKRVRGFTSGLGNDRWYGPGSAPCHGGSGHEQISGFAGQRG